MPGTNTDIQFASLDVILPLRQAVIIAGTNRTSPYFPGDDVETTRHVAAWHGEECVGCATLLRAAWEGQPAWQLRGMAVAPTLRKQGVGRAVLAFLERELPRIAETRFLWCNARESAAPFYIRAGFEMASERFLIENVGYHYRLFKFIPSLLIE